MVISLNEISYDEFKPIIRVDFSLFGRSLIDFKLPVIKLVKNIPNDLKTLIIRDVDVIDLEYKKLGLESYVSFSEDKVYKKYIDNNSLLKALYECSDFNKFYGEGKAKVYLDSYNLILEMTKIEGVTLKEAFEKNIEISHPFNKFIFLIEKLHSLNIVHMDLSLSNIMINSNHEFTPIDFTHINSLSEQSFYSDKEEIKQSLKHYACLIEDLAFSLLRYEDMMKKKEKDQKPDSSDDTEIISCVIL